MALKSESKNKEDRTEQYVDDSKETVSIDSLEN